MVLEELPELVDLVIGFCFLQLDRNVISVVQGKGRLITGFRMFNDRVVLGEISLSRGDAVDIEIVLEQLALLKTNHDAAQAAE